MITTCDLGREERPQRWSGLNNGALTSSAFVEFWLHSMRTPAARDAVAQWLRTVREHNAKEITERCGGEPPMPAGQLATLMTALDIGVAFQHLIDPEHVPADLYARGLTAIIGPDELGS
jgi:Tetracyclin repressor-like, C-terminal domain